MITFVLKKRNRKSVYAHDCIENFWKEMQKKNKNTKPNNKNLLIVIDSGI